VKSLQIIYNKHTAYFMLCSWVLMCCSASSISPLYILQSLQ